MMWGSINHNLQSINNDMTNNHTKKDNSISKISEIEKNK